MDVFYYWKNVESDVDAGRIGYLQSGAETLTRLKAGYPGYLWFFKTPKGQKGRLQLLGRLLWSDTALASAGPAPAGSHIHYDPDHPKSVWYEGSESENAVTAVTAWAAEHFHAAVRANFQGVNGQHEMRGAVLQELEGIGKGLSTRAFRSVAP
ncbi:MAG: hypothetical protein M3Y32_02070 [Pseudomonadota bacterium]|nr:hypothetical protein [Pseudomonadota bacterium]